LAASDNDEFGRRQAETMTTASYDYAVLLASLHARQSDHPDRSTLDADYFRYPNVTQFLDVRTLPNMFLELFLAFLKLEKTLNKRHIDAIKFR